MKNFVGIDVLPSLKNLLDELSSEIDLHYEDDDLVATLPTIRKMQEAGDILIRNGIEHPEAFRHIQSRLANCMAK